MSGMAEEYKEEKTNRRGCFLVAIIILLTVALIAAFGMGWLGTVDEGKVTDIPALEGASGTTGSNR